MNEASPADQTLAQAIKDVHGIIPPLWPLADYVAVNPCAGLAERPFLAALRLLGSVRDCDLLMPRGHFQTMLAEGRILPGDLHAAHAQCRLEYPEWYDRFGPAEMAGWLAAPAAGAGENDDRFRTVAEAVDGLQGSSWSSHIINDITRHCASHYDEGQAAWASPWRDTTLYAAWLEAAQFSRRMDFLGLPGFRAFVAKLPADPKQAVKELLLALGVPPAQWRMFLLCETFSVAGWASYVRYRVREAEFAGREDEDLVGLVAIRLAYDAALAQAPGIPRPLRLWPADAPPRPAPDMLARYALQVAAEASYRRELLSKLAAQPGTPKPPSRKTLQMVFCIDVRSEIMRRNLESVHESIETFGFAGFFGMALEYVPIGSDKGTPQCPVLLKPGFRVHEKAARSPDGGVIRKRIAVRQSRKLWKSFQNSATSCFSFVESLGLPYAAKLLTDSLHWTKPSASADADGLSGNPGAELGPDIHARHNRGLDANRRIELAEGMLRNLGLTGGFARMVALCGHASDVTNNPYRSALDCGACGGHSGEPNARVAAALLNDTDVRAGLSSRGIDIPGDTWFLAAVHNTTTDNIDICDAGQVPASHADDLAAIRAWLGEAGRLSRMERSPRLGSRDPGDVLRRSRDWAEVRPEWGLAGNAAFIVAPRSRTAGIRLDGRTFMHSYNHLLDPGFKVLELIMTAPMIVTNWINMQYYASAVDPAAFGSGNKVLHNVVGQFGVLQGNGGDLMTGLPWQSVHDGARLQHEPLRLLVVIEAPRHAVEQLIAKHAMVRDLVTNGWMTLTVLDGGAFFRWTSPGAWAEG